MRTAGWPGACVRYMGLFRQRHIKNGDEIDRHQHHSENDGRKLNYPAPPSLEKQARDAGQNSNPAHVPQHQVKQLYVGHGAFRLNRQFLCPGPPAVPPVHPAKDPGSTRLRAQRAGRASSVGVTPGAFDERPGRVVRFVGIIAGARASAVLRARRGQKSRSPNLPGLICHLIASVKSENIGLVHAVRCIRVVGVDPDHLLIRQIVDPDRLARQRIHAAV